MNIGSFRFANVRTVDEALEASRNMIAEIKQRSEQIREESRRIEDLEKARAVLLEWAADEVARHVNPDSLKYTACPSCRSTVSLKRSCEDGTFECPACKRTNHVTSGVIGCPPDIGSESNSDTPDETGETT